MKKRIIEQNPDNKGNIEASVAKKKDEVAINYLTKYWKDQPYFYKTLWLAIGVMALCLAANIVSIGTAFTYVRYRVEPWAGLKYAAAFALLFLTAWEVVKYLVGVFLYKHYHRTGDIIFQAILALVVILSLSAFMSYNGGNDLVLEHSAKAALINTDSIAQAYNSRIDSINSKISYWQKRISKNDDWTARAKTIPHLETEAAKLRSQRQAALTSAELKNDKAETEHITTKTYNASHVAFIGALADLVLQIGLYFIVYWKWFSAKDYEQRINNEEQEVENSEDTEIDTPPKQHRIIPPIERIAAAKKSPEIASFSTNTFKPETHETQGFQPKVSTEIKELKVDATELIRNIRNYYRRRVKASTPAARTANNNKYIEAKEDLEAVGYIVKEITDTTLSIKKA